MSTGTLKSILPSPLYKLVSQIITTFYKLNPNAWRTANWEREGKPNPPPHIVKVRTVKNYALDYPVFVETGTFMGDMVKAMAGKFDKIYSIELDEKLYKNAVEKFKRDKSVEILNGDSGRMLPLLLNRVDMPVAFWLDGHYSGGVTAKGESVTPIMKELRAIQDHMAANNVKDLIMIDDANLFNGTDDYPTLEAMQDAQKKFFPSYSFFVENNIIFLKPQ